MNTIYAVPSPDGHGLVIRKCFRCARRHFVAGLGKQWLRCGIEVTIRSTDEKPAGRRF